RRPPPNAGWTFGARTTSAFLHRAPPNRRRRTEPARPSQYEIASSSDEPLRTGSGKGNHSLASALERSVSRGPAPDRGLPTLLWQTPGSGLRICRSPTWWHSCSRRAFRRPALIEEAQARLSACPGPALAEPLPELRSHLPCHEQVRCRLGLELPAFSLESAWAERDGQSAPPVPSGATRRSRAIRHPARRWCESDHLIGE